MIEMGEMNRVCFGVELEPRFVDVAIRRWQAFTGEKAVRKSDGAEFEAVAASVGDEGMES